MNQHRFALALCALFSSLVLTDVANAYPTSSGTTIPKSYRPIDLHLNTLVENTDGCDSCDGVDYFTEVKPTTNELSLTLVFTGDWTPNLEDPDNVYDPPVEGGFAGYWVYELDTNAYENLVVSTLGDVVTVSGEKGGVAFGTFTHVGGFKADQDLPTEDTPLPGDVFKLFTTTEAGAKLQVTLLNGGSDFAVLLTGALVHVGPFFCEDDDAEGGDGNGEACKVSSLSQGLNDEFCEIDDLTLDMNRNFEGCEGAGDPLCGRVTALDATSVPEPGTLALFGFGFASLGIGFRSRRKAPLA